MACNVVRYLVRLIVAKKLLYLPYEKENDMGDGSTVGR
jgi:hypothetical protein